MKDGGPAFPADEHGETTVESDFIAYRYADAMLAAREAT